MGKMVKPRILAFGLIVAVLLVSIIIYFQKSEQTPPRQQFLIKNLPFESILQKAIIKGVTKKGFWVLKADKVLSKDKLSEIRFISPELLITLNDNSTLNVSAQRGFYFKQLKRIEFEYKIKGKYKDIILVANFMNFNLKLNKITFKNGFKISNNQLIVSGLEGIIDLNKHIITLKKNVRVKII